MPSRRVEYRVVEGVAEVALSRIDAANAIDLAMYREICAALERAAADESARAILVRAEGQDFSVGEDIDYLAGLERDGRFGEWTAGYKGWIPSTWHNPKFVVASVRGRALGVGCELALLADVTYASKNAVFGHPETQRGMVSHTVWPWLVGPKVAKEYLASGAGMSGEVAAQKGLINAAIDDDALDAHVLAFVRDLATMPPGTPGANKKRINWAYRDISRVLHDDRHYDVDFEWLVKAREVDYAFYSTVARDGVTEAVRKRDTKFSK